MSDWWSADPIAGGSAPAPSGRPRIIVTKQDPSPYADAISKVESGGRYDVLGPRTRTGDQAYGKYQVMGQNVGPWTREVLGQEMTPQQFLASPEAQDAVFNAKFGAYAQKYGPEGAAKAWFAGEGGMNDPNRRDILGTSVADYARKFTGAMGSGPAQAQPAPAAPAQESNWWASDPVAPQNNAPQPAAESPQAPPGIGQGRALGEGVRSGVTFNFGDELAGVNAASGLTGVARAAAPPGVNDIIGLARLGYEYLTGQDGTATKLYQKERDEIRGAQKQAEEHFPGTYMGGQVAGAIAMPLGGAAGAATLPFRVGRSALIGGVTGAVSGAGAGENAEDRATRAATGGGAGLVLGGAAPAAIKGVEIAGRGVGAAFRPLATTIRGARDPESEAARRVLAARQRDVRAGDAGLSDAEFASSRAAGVPVANVDQGGSVTRSLARSAANTSPEARGALERTTSDRFEGQGPRAVEFLANLVSTRANATWTREALEKAAQTARKPYYDRAYRDGAAGIWDNEFSQLSQAPAVQDAVKAAIVQAQNRSASGRAGGYLSPSGKPTLEFWDLVKRQLDQKINVARRAGEKEDVMELNDLRSIIVKKLDKAVPTYATARGVAAELFKASNALEAGEMFVTSGKIHEVARIMGKMGREEQELFAEGFVSAFIEKVNKVGDRRSILNQIGQSSDARQRFNLVLGPQKSKELEAFLRTENIMDRMRGALQGSTTVRQLAEAGLAGGATGLYTGDVTQAGTAAGLVFALRSGGKLLNQRIDENVSRKVGEMLASSDPKVLQKGVALVSKNPRLMELVRSADNATARIVGPQSSEVAPVQALIPGRAEEDQPQIQRPSR